MKDTKLVKLRERMLLLSSKTIEDYAWLYDFLEKNPDMGESELGNLSPDIQNFFKNMFKLIIKQASEEWTSKNGYPVDVLDGDERIPCQLCHQPIKNICNITNKSNGNELVVGSECVKHFGMNIGISPAKLFKERLRTKKLEKLNREFPGIANIIDSWSIYLDKFDILIPNNIERPYLELGSRARSLYQNYLDDKGVKCDEQILFDTFKQFISEREQLLLNIENYVNTNIYNKYTPKKETVSWLTREGRKEAIAWLKEDGVITWRTAHRIEEPQFMNLFIAEFNSAIEKTGVRIEKSEQNYKGKRGYVIRPFTNIDLRLFCKHSEFVINYGGLIFNKGNVPLFNINDLLNIGLIYDEKSIDIVVYNLNMLLRGSRVSIKEHDIDFNEIIIFENKSGKYVIIELAPFIEQYKKLALGLDERSIENVVSYINNLTVQRYSLEELKDIKSMRDRF